MKWELGAYYARWFLGALLTLSMCGCPVGGDVPTGVRQRCPSPCHCLGTHVDCSHRDLSTLPNMFPAWTTHLELQGNFLKELDPTAFVGLDDLITLDLSDNQIESFSRLLFAQTPQLQYLVIRRNRLSSIPLGIESLSNLRKLDLKGNQIANITAIDVSRFAKVDVVDIGRNLIKDCPVAELVNRADSKIVKLDLSNNAITALRPNAFSALRSLRVLKLSRNSIDEVDDSAFNELAGLRSLDLSRNKLTSVRALTFKVLISLQNLTLARNSISSLEAGAFYGLQQLQKLSLAENRIKTVTTGWIYGLRSLTTLDLSSNEISWVEWSVWSCCPSLQWLSFASNRLRTIASSSFSKLSRLEYLSLASNNIDSLHSNAFDGLNRLASLDLTGNVLAMFVEDGSLFANVTLPALVTLKLGSNRIREVPQRVFHSVSALESLDLTDNPIATISEGAFDHLPLKYLYINTSSLVCDCEMKWFSPWLFASSLSRDTVSTICLHPSPLQGVDVVVVDTSNLTCVDNSPRARLLAHPVVLTKALLNSTVRLWCTGYGASPLEISWRVVKGGRSRLLTQDSTTDFFSNCSSLLNGSSGDFTAEYLCSELRLSEVGFSDDADYQCIVRNHYSSAYSQRARIVVLQKPQIHYSPSNVSILKGGNARLRCSARGVPAPVVKWEKDGGHSFPAAIERRVHVKANDDNLYVVNVSLADAGVYTCRVSNEAGHAESSAHMRVYDSEIRPKLEDQKAQLGAVVIFNCSINVRPPVAARWLRDGQSLEPASAPSRFSFRASNQILILAEAHLSDSGTYTCEFEVGGDVLSSASAVLSVVGEWDDSNKRRVYERPSDNARMSAILFPCLLVVLVCLFICYSARNRSRCYTSIKAALRDGSAPSSLPTQPTDGTSDGADGGASQQRAVVHTSV